MVPSPQGAPGLQDRSPPSDRIFILYSWGVLPDAERQRPRCGMVHLLISATGPVFKSFHRHNEVELVSGESGALTYLLGRGRDAAGG